MQRTLHRRQNWTPHHHLILTFVAVGCRIAEISNQTNLRSSSMARVLFCFATPPRGGRRCYHSDHTFWATQLVGSLSEWGRFDRLKAGGYSWPDGHCLNILFFIICRMWCPGDGDGYMYIPNHLKSAHRRHIFNVIASYSIGDEDDAFVNTIDWKFLMCNLLSALSCCSFEEVKSYLFLDYLKYCNFGWNWSFVIEIDAWFS